MAVAIPRARTVSARTFLRIATGSTVALFLVITSGAFVRLTGSGLGCENWPSCGDRPYPEQVSRAIWRDPPAVLDLL